MKREPMGELVYESWQLGQHHLASPLFQSPFSLSSLDELLNLPVHRFHDV